MTTTDTANAPTLLDRAKALLNGNAARTSAAIVPLALAQHAQSATIFQAATGHEQFTSYIDDTNVDGSAHSTADPANQRVKLSGHVYDTSKMGRTESGGGMFALPYKFAWGKYDADDATPGAAVVMDHASISGDKIRLDYEFTIDYSDSAGILDEKDLANLEFTGRLTLGLVHGDDYQNPFADDVDPLVIPISAHVGLNEDTFTFSVPFGTQYTAWYVWFQLDDVVGEFTIPGGETAPTLTVDIPGSSIDLTYVSGTVGIPDPDHVTVPMPTASWMGFATLVGLAGADFFRRKRSAGK